MTPLDNWKKYPVEGSLPPSIPAEESDLMKKGVKYGQAVFKTR